MAVFDVAIVGGGPAGAWAATKLSAGGALVALIDGSHPREKPCGGGVTGRALDLLGSSVEEVPYGVPIHDASFAHRDRIAAVSLTDSPSAPPGVKEPRDKMRPRLAVVPRRAFDQELLERARASGASLLTTRATEVNRSAAGWRITTREGTVESRWLIGADGPGSLVRRRVSTPFLREDLSIAAGYYVHGATRAQVDIAFEDDPAGYLWSFPRHDHLAVGVCAQADVTTTAQLLSLTEKWINRHVETGRRERYSWPIPSLRVETLRREQPAGPGWLLAGDAAGLVDPITREGIFFALSSGEHAAAALLEGRDPARAYAERLRDTVYAELLLAAQLKARFFRPAFMGLLISALNKSGPIRAIMADLVSGEQPYGSLRRRLIRTMELRLMLELFGLTRSVRADAMS